MKERVIFVVLSILTVIYLTGCATKASFVYSVGPKYIDNVNKDLHVAVLPFEDLRSYENKNSVLLYLIPLMPYGFMNYDRLDAANGFLTHSSYNFRPTEDLAKALVSELKNNKLFSEIFFTYRDNEPNVDLYITGEITNTKYYAKMYSYGLSIFGPLLWLVGLPAGVAKNELILTIKVYSATNKEELLAFNISGEWKKTVGLYYNWGTEFDGYDKILHDGFKDFVIELTKELESDKFSSLKRN